MLIPIIVAATLTAAGSGVAYGVHRARSKSPRGKGVFIRSVRHAASPSALADACASMGLSWVAILLVWQVGERDKLFFPEDLPRVVAELDRRGIDTWVWAWPEPRRAQTIVDLYRVADQRCGGQLRGLILDPEKPYYSSRLEAQTQLDVNTLRTLRVPLGVTSYGGGPPNHPSFPWGPWATCDFGMPQLYAAPETFGEGYFARGIESWQDVGFKTIVPVLSAVNTKTPEQMQESIDLTPRIYTGLCWWDFYWLARSSKRQAVVRDLRLPRRQGKRIADGRIA